MFHMCHLIFCHKTHRGQSGPLDRKSHKLFAPPPPSRQGKNFHAPPFKEWKLFEPPLQYGLNFKQPCKNYPKTSCAPPPPFNMAKTFSAPPFRRAKTSCAPPPLPFCSPPPLPVISDQSLSMREKARPFLNITRYLTIVS